MSHVYFSQGKSMIWLIIYFLQGAIIVEILHSNSQCKMQIENYRNNSESVAENSGGFKGGPEGAWAHPVIGPLLVIC